MPPKKPAPRSDELFRSQLDNMIDMEHALVKLAGLIDWSRFDEAYGRFYHEKGRPGTQKAGLYPWFEVPGHVPREMNLVCGHWSTLGLFMGLGVYGIDSGCVWGGKLTALELGPESRIIQVPGKEGGKPGED